MDSIGYGYAWSIGNAIRRASSAGVSGSGSSTARIPRVVLDSLRQIDGELAGLQANYNLITGQLTHATNLVKEMVKDNPNAYMTLGI